MKRFCAAWLFYLLALPSVEAASTPWVGDANAAVRLLTATQAVGNQDRVTLALDFRFAPGWHGYWRTPGETGLPPTLDWTGSQNLVLAEPRYPIPTRIQRLGLEAFAYEHSVLLPIEAKLLDPSQPLPIRLGVDYLACTTICVPYHADLALTLPAGTDAPSPEAARIADGLRRVPVDPETAGVEVESAELAGELLRLTLNFVHPLTAEERAKLDLFLEGPAALTAARPNVGGGGNRLTLEAPLKGVRFDDILTADLTATLVAGERRVEFPLHRLKNTSLEATSSLEATWGPMLGIALLGGLILNLMPCVLPVLSLKLLGLVGMGGKAPRNVRGNLLATAAGILISFLLLAGTASGMKLLHGAIGWGIQFQQPWFLAAMTGVLALFSGSLLSGRDLTLPTAVSSWAGKLGRGSRGEAFLSGMVATLLATPCSAPFVGTAVGFALAQGPGMIFLIFLALAIGFASPFLLLALFPAWIRFLPKPGVWMLWVKRGFGLALLGTAGWLLTLLAALIDPLVLAAISGIVLALIAGMLWMRRGFALVAAAGLSALIALPELALPWDSPLSAPKEGEFWRPWRPETLTTPQTTEKVIFLDITADWCLTCKVNKLAVLDRKAVRQALSLPGTLALRADWTRPNAKIADFLNRHGRAGIPFNIVYGPGAPAGILLPELLTQEAVLEALDRARNKT